MREQARRFVHRDPVRPLGHHAEVVLRATRCSETLVFLMIQLSHVSRVYQSAAGEVHALRDVSLEIAPRTFAAVTGPSGCGKSTLLNLLGGLDQPTSGEITVDGLRLDGADDAALTAYRRERLGVVFQFFNLLPSMTAVENVELPLLLRGDRAREARARAMEMLDLAGLNARAGSFPHQMSGGEMQRAAVARALVHRPSLLLADEPTGNLDSDNAARVLSLLQKIASQGLATLIIVTHSPEAAAVAHRQIPMIDGRLAT
jgi:putative ABC transport system ATP-binding protein